jgi:hypothetical protein
MTKKERKSGTAKTGAAGGRRQVKVPRLKRSPATDLATAKSGEPQAGSPNKTPTATGETGREFPDAVYQDHRRN